MRVRSSLIMGLFIAIAATAQQTPFELSFDNGFAAENGANPITQEGVRLTGGRSGQAAEFVKGAVLTYSTADIIQPARGSLSLWIRPNWDSRNAFGDRFFWGIDNDPGSGNRTVLGFLGKDGLGTLYFGGDGALGGLAAPVDWRAGEWHQVMVCWDENPRCRALYVDGVLKHFSRWVGAMPGAQSVFHLGSLPCVTRWMGILDGHEADATLDDIRISQTPDGPDFERVRQAAREDDKAMERFQQSRDKARPEYEKAWEKLLQAPSLTSVAEEHAEPAWEELTGLAAPLSQRIPIEARYHPEVVFVHPDLSIALGRANAAYGIGFALGAPFELPDMYAVTRGLYKGYMPIVESEWNTSVCTLHQTAFTILPRDEETVTGNEPQEVIIRMRLENPTQESKKIPLLLLIGLMEGQQNTNYAPFLASASRWVSPPMDCKVDANHITVDGKSFLSFQCNAPVQAEFLPEYATGASDPLFPETLTNTVRFSFDLAPGATADLDLTVAATPRPFPPDGQNERTTIPYNDALARAEAYWNKGLEPGMKLTTPEPRLNDIYRYLIFSCLNNLTKNPERPWHEPFQSPVWEGVWPWECAHMVMPMCAIGYHREMEPTLRFFTERQTGRGAYAEPGRGPEGEIRSTYGCYTGNFLLRWMSETGAILWAMAEKYRYSRDPVWLQENKESILAAWDWIQGERLRTRRYTDSGEPVAYYGLLPKGRVHDWDEWHYFFFSDVYTWKGMAEIAAAFQEAGFPEADRFICEAEEYRENLLTAIEKAQFTDPDTGLLFIPNLVFYQNGERGGLWWADGPSCMFSTGLLDARTDPRFGDMFAYLDQTWGTMLGLTNRMDEPKELGKKNPFWYVNSSERGYFQNFLARNEIEKALLMFYSNLVYGMSSDCYQTVERIHVSDANYAPFQPNASGNGRILDMFKRMVIDEQDPGVLWLLRACPRRWFAAGQSIRVQDAPTYYGRMAVCASSTENQVTIDIEPPEGPALPELRVVVRHPSRNAPKQVLLNGIETAMENETIVLPATKDHLQVICRY